MKFTKMHGAGNDFVLVEAANMKYDWQRVSIAMCDRHFGIGADGLLLLLPSKTADCRMRVFDCDGTEAEACGNGIRCLVKYFADSRDNFKNEISVETIAGVREAKVYKNGGKVTRVQIGMGEPAFKADEIPVVVEVRGKKLNNTESLITLPVTVDEQEMQLSTVSMGNPHAVFFTKQPVSEFPLSRIGPQVEHHAIFPRRVNFEIVNIKDRKHAEARVWERGVGETLACGSGACAIMVAGQLMGLFDNRVDVKLPGGLLEVEWHGKGEVLLSGPAETVFTGVWPDEHPSLINK